MNNGLQSYFINSQPIGPPTIGTQPASPGRVLAGRTVTFEVVAYPKARYRWQLNGADVPGATNAILTLTNVQTANGGLYHVIVSNSGGSTTSADASLGVINPADLYHLSPPWSAAPGVQPYVTSTGGASTPSERGFGYNALSNQVLVVQRSGNNYTVHVVDGTSGTKLYNLKTNGILPVVASEVSGQNGVGLVAITVADDGAVYACNESPNAGGGATFNTSKLFRAYRWANSDSNTLPVEIFNGDPAAQSSNFRWGDVLSARGSGLSTQLILDNQNTSARYLAMLRPADGSMTSFPAQYFFQDTLTPFGGSIGRSIQFGTGNTVWQKRRAAALIQSSFDPGAPSGTTIAAVLATYTNLPSAIGQVGVDTTRNLVIGIDYLTTASVADTLDLFDFSDPNAPLLLAQYNFPFQHPANPNPNFIGQVILSGDKVFALDGNNGMLAFRIVSGPQTPPTITVQPHNLQIISGNNASVSVVTADIATFQWQFNNVSISGATNSTYTINNINTNGAGPYRVIVSNDAGSVTSLTAVVTVVPADGFPHLTPCWSLAPQSRAYLPKDADSQGRTPLYRGIAYNALSNQVYVISRTGQTNGLSIRVLNALTGADLYSLILGTIHVQEEQLIRNTKPEPGAGYASPPKRLLIKPLVFKRVLLTALFALCLGFAAILLWCRSIDPRDVTGATLTAIVFSYLVHLWMPSRKPLGGEGK